MTSLRARLPRSPAVLWAPAGLIALLIVLPVAYLFFRALASGGAAADLVFRSYTARVLLNSLALAAIVAGGTALLALPIAWLTVRTDLPLRRLWSVLTVLSLAIPSYVGAMLVMVALGPKGMLQRLLEPLGVERLPDIYGLPGAALVLTLLCFPYVLLVLRGALMSLDPALEEAARSLGKGAWRVFFEIILPQLRPAIAAGCLLVALYTMADFGAVSLLRYETFTWAIYLQYQSAFDRTLAAVLSLILVLVALVLISAEMRVRGRLRYDRSGAGAERLGRPVPLGRWRWPALLFLGAVVLAALVLPVGVLCYWAVKGVLAGHSLEWINAAARNSVYVSTIAALVTVAAAIPVTLLSVRYPSWFSTLLERASFIGFALPGLAVALSLVFFGIRFAPAMYHSLVMLVFAYGVLFFPTAMSAGRARLLQISPRMEEVARSLGKRQLHVFATITGPLMRPGLAAGAGMVFLLCMKELPATLLLAPLDFRTLATSIWASTGEAFYTKAAVQALLLVLLSSISVGLILAQERRSLR